MPRLKKVFFPSENTEVTPFVENADDGLTTGGLGLKYSVPAADMTKSAGYKTDIPNAIAEAANATAAAQAKNLAKDNLINEARLFYKKMGRDWQEKPVFDAVDMETMGFFKLATPPDPNTAKPEVETTILPEKIIFDWKKKGWGGVMVRTSYDGITWSAGEKDLRSPWEDTRTNQQAGVPETRHTKFRHIDAAGNEIGLETIIKLVVDIE
jgi:hypothetical protein